MLSLKLLPSQLPPGVSQESLVADVTQALKDTRRFSKPATIEMKVALEQHPTFGANYVTTLRWVEGEEEYAMGCSAQLLSSTSSQVAYLFADPAYYPELLRSQGFTGSHVHPRVKELDPADVLATALAAAINNSAQGLQQCGQRMLRIARQSLQPEHYLRAADILELAGDLDHARLALLEAAQRLPWDKQAPFGSRKTGLDLRQRVGDQVLGLVVAMGQGLGAQAAGRLDKQRLGSLILLMMRLGLLSQTRVKAPDWEPVGGTAGAIQDGLGAYAVELFKLAFFAETAMEEEVRQTGFKVIPLLIRLAPQQAAQLQGQMGLSLQQVRSVLQPGLFPLQRWAPILAGEAEMSRLIAQDPAFQEAYFHRALDRVMRGEVNGSLQDLDHLLKLDPSHSEALLLKGSLYRDTGRPQESLRALALCLQGNPWKTEALITQGLALSEDGQVEQGLASVGRALALLPASQRGHGYYVEGSILLEAGRWAEAAASLQKTLSLQPENPEALINLGICLRHLRRSQEALQALNAGLKLKPSLINGNWHRAYVRLDLNHTKEAATDFRIVAQAIPQSEMGQDSQAKLKELEKRKGGWLGRLFGR